MYYLIHQQSGESRERINLQFLRQIANQCFEANYQIIITDNSIATPTAQENIIKLPCNNEFREFSGWEVGIHYLENEVGTDKLSGVLLSNETLLKHRPFDRAKRQAMIDAVQFIKSAPYPAMAGDLDLIRAQGPYHYPSMDSFYISTYFCFINKSARGLLKTLYPDKNLKELLNPKPNSESVLLQEKREFAAKHYQFIEEWLYKKHPGPKWYAHEKLSKKNYGKMAMKFMSIIIEHGISQKFVIDGGKLVDYKGFIKRTLLEKIIFFLKRIRYSLGWRLNRFF
jgi:hypothetical protein